MSRKAVIAVWSALVVTGGIGASAGEALAKNSETPKANSEHVQKASGGRTVIQSATGGQIVVRNLADALTLRNRDRAGGLRRNFGWRVVVNLPYLRIACPIGVVSGVVVAVYRYRQWTGRWPGYWDVVRWTRGACS